MRAPLLPFAMYARAMFRLGCCHYRASSVMSGVKTFDGGDDGMFVCIYV